MKRKLTCFCALTLLIATSTASADVLDGSLAGDSYGSAQSVQSVQTEFGDNASELNAGYATATVSDNMLRLMLTGNLESNFNKLNIFIASVAGGQNQIAADDANGGVNPSANSDGIFENYSGVVAGGAGNGSGFTFDAGFNADYVLIARNGATQFDLNFLSIGNASTAEESIDVFGGSTEGAIGAVGASGTGVGFNNSNDAGIMGGTGAADATAAQAVETGLELWIPLSAIGNPGLGDTILISAHVNGSNHDFLSNQSLGGVAAGTANLGGDGSGVFNDDVSLIDFNNFAGNQYFSVSVVPEPSAMAMLGALCLGFVARRRRV